MGYRPTIKPRYVNFTQEIQPCSDIPKGSTHINPKSNQPFGTWQEVTVGVDVVPPRNVNPKDQWSRCSHVIAESGDKCKPDSWVFFRTPCDSSPMIDEVLLYGADEVTLGTDQVTGFCGENCSDPPVQGHQSCS